MSEITKIKEAVNSYLDGLEARELPPEDYGIEIECDADGMVYMRIPIPVFEFKLEYDKDKMKGLFG